MALRHVVIVCRWSIYRIITALCKRTVIMPVTPEQQAEIDELRSNAVPTLRAVAPGMEKHLYTAHEVLDHGFVRVIDYMGDDAAICQAARVSYGKGLSLIHI